MKVIKGTRNDLHEIVDFAYPLQSVVRTRCRPLLIDCNKDELTALFESYIDRDMHELLIIRENKIVIGVTPIYWMKEDKYISYSQGPYGLDYDKVSSVFLKYVEENFEGYKFYINTSKEHRKSRNFFNNNKFTQLEDATLLKLENFTIRKSSSNVKILNDENKNMLFASIDKETDEDTYWNSSRINVHMDKFIILGYFNSDIQGHIIGRRGKNGSIEIIGFKGNNFVKEELFIAFINQVEDKGLNRIELYTEEETEIKLGAKYSFSVYDTNICYIKYL